MKVDLVIENAWVYRTFRQCFERMDIAVAGGKFFDVSPVSDFVGDSEQRVSARRGEWETESVFDGTGKFVIPGLVDIHMHVESSMTYPEEFSRAVVPFGVTTVVADPHEIANVFGLEGILSFMEQETELDIFMVFRPVFRLPEKRWRHQGRSLGKRNFGSFCGMSGWFVSGK